jgi:hypothetical protein
VVAAVVSKTAEAAATVQRVTLKTLTLRILLNRTLFPAVLAAVDRCCLQSSMHALAVAVAVSVVAAAAAAAAAAALVVEAAVEGAVVTAVVEATVVALVKGLEGSFGVPLGTKRWLWR